MLAARSDPKLARDQDIARKFIKVLVELRHGKSYVNYGTSKQTYWKLGPHDFWY